MTLRVEGLEVFHGQSRALRGVSFSVVQGEILCLMGRNGAGKTTTLRAIMGTLPIAAGRVLLDDRDVSTRAAHEIPRLGLAHVPQGRRLFAELTVKENLEIGLQVRRSPRRALDFALELFPILAERMSQRSGTLSGGEQTMLSVARAICMEPRAILLDEPTEGLMPQAVATIRSALLRLRSENVAVLLVEQRAEAVLAMADRIVFLDHGQVAAEAAIDDIRADRTLLLRHVGV